jgi:hypothetical protein
VRGDDYKRLVRTREEILARLEEERHCQNKDESREHQKNSWAHGGSGFENHDIIHTRDGEKFLSLTTGGDVWIQFKNLQVVG